VRGDPLATDQSQPTSHHTSHFTTSTRRLAPYPRPVTNCSPGSTPLPWLPVLSNIEPPALRRKAATDKLVEKIVKHDSWPIQPDILSPPLLRLTSRKPLWLDLQPVDIKSRWRHNWKSAQVVSSHLVCDPTIRQPGFDLPRQQRSRYILRRPCRRCRPVISAADVGWPAPSAVVFIKTV